jgi:hypothetical protein
MTAPVTAKASPVSKLAAGPVLQRKCACGTHTPSGGTCATCAEGEHKLRRKATSSEGRQDAVPDIVQDVLRSAGQPLDTATRAQMEPRFGHDFSGVRVHTGTQADRSARAVGALAYTVGRDIVFSDGQYQPATPRGQRLLAHELTHTVQQRGQTSAVQPRLAIGPADDVFEREADRIAERVMSGAAERVHTSSLPAVRLQRECEQGVWKVVYDGCSGPSGPAGELLDLVFDRDNPAGGKNTQFSRRKPSDDGGRACDRHDECYQTCHHDSSAKHHCDKQFHDDLVGICHEHAEGPHERAKCLGWATAYYGIVRSAGGKAFHQRQEQVCNCGVTAQNQAEPTHAPDGSRNARSTTGDATAALETVVQFAPVTFRGTVNRIAPSQTTDVAVSVSKLPKGGTLHIDVTGSGVMAGWARIVAGKTLSGSGTVAVRGVTQTMPSHRHALQLRARVSGKEVGRSPAFAVAAYPIAFSDSLLADIDTPDSVGLKVQDAWKSDGRGPAGELHHTTITERVDLEKRDDPPFKKDGAVSATKEGETSGYLDASQFTRDSHGYARSDISFEKLGAGTWTIVYRQLSLFSCARTQVADQVMPNSGLTITHIVTRDGKGHATHQTVKTGAAVTVEGRSATAASANVQSKVHTL